MAVVIPTTPSVDPAFLAFLRSQGMEESDIAGEIARRTSSITRGLALNAPVYEENLQQGLKGISESFEDRGISRSGQRLVAQQEFSNDQNRQRMGAEANARQQIADLNSSGAAQVAALRRRTAEQEMATRGGLV